MKVKSAKTSGRTPARPGSFRSRPVSGTAAIVASALTVASLAAFPGTAGASTRRASSEAPVTLTIAMAANPQMEAVEKLTSDFHAKYPWITLRYDTLPENSLRPQTLEDVSTHAGQFQVVMLSGVENGPWAHDGWLLNLSKNYIDHDPAYEVNDLSTMARATLSLKGDLYSVPFYSSSSFTMYNKALFKAAGLTMPLHPTWAQIEQLASKLNDPAKKVSGICLRGLSGWGEVGAPLGTVINAFGGSWFTNNWKPTLTSAAYEKAVTFYVNLLRNYGEPGAASFGWEECLPYFAQGHSAMWVDDTVFAESALAEAAAKGGVGAKNIGFAYMPSDVEKWTGWAWSWSLGIPTGFSKHVDDAAWDYLAWATGPGIAKEIADKVAVSSVPPGARDSTNNIPSWKKFSAPFMKLYTTQEQHAAAGYCHPAVAATPYCGGYYVEIPQYENFGQYWSEEIAAAISGKTSVKTALAKSQAYTANLMKSTDYYGKFDIPDHGF